MKLSKSLLFALLATFLFSGFLAFFMPSGQAFRIGFGTVYLLFLPGFIWIHALAFNTDDLLVRVVFSIPLSMILVVLSMYYVNFVGIKITDLSIFITVLLLCILGSVVLLKKNRK